jgi:hemerythrin-like domain-containing protein
MKCIDILVREHDLVRLYLETLTLAIDRMEVAQRPPREFFDRAVTFSREYVDRYHHRKEELQAFVRLARRQRGIFDRRIDVLQRQHEHGREHVIAIAERLDAYDAGDPVALLGVLEHAAAYRSMLRLHVHVEDHQFFPAAAAALTEADDEDLLRIYREENQRVGPGFEDGCREMLRSMRGMVLGSQPAAV